jgi:hypothetical protein
MLDGGSGRERCERGVEGRRERAERAGRPRFCITFRQRKHKKQTNAHSAASPALIAPLSGGSHLSTDSPLVFHRIKACRRLTRCSSSCRKAPCKELSRLADRAGHDRTSLPHALTVRWGPLDIHQWGKRLFSVGRRGSFEQEAPSYGVHPSPNSS